MLSDAAHFIERKFIFTETKLKALFYIFNFRWLRYFSLIILSFWRRLHRDKLIKIILANGELVVALKRQINCDRVQNAAAINKPKENCQMADRDLMFSHLCSMVFKLLRKQTYSSYLFKLLNTHLFLLQFIFRIKDYNFNISVTQRYYSSIIRILFII